MTLGAEHEKAPEFGDTFAQFDVGAASGHVRRDGHRSAQSGAGDDLRLLHMELRIQDGVRNFVSLQHPAENLGGLDTCCSDKDRLSATMGGLDLVNGCGKLFPAGFVDAVVFVDARDDTVGRDDGDLESVNVVEFVGLGLGCSGHAGEFLVQAEVILDGDRGHRLCFPVDLDTLLGLDGLMESVAPAAARHLASGEGIDDDDLVLLNDILHILLVEAEGLQELGNVVHPLGGVVAMLLRCSLLRNLLSIAQGCIGLDVCKLGQKIGQDEGVRIVGVEKVASHLREVGLLLLLFYGEVEFFLQGDEGILGGVLIERELGLVCEAAQLGILHGAEQSLVAGLAQLDLEKRETGLFFLPLVQ